MYISWFESEEITNNDVYAINVISLVNQTVCIAHIFRDDKKFLF